MGATWQIFFLIEIFQFGTTDPEGSLAKPHARQVS